MFSVWLRAEARSKNELMHSSTVSVISIREHGHFSIFLVLNAIDLKEMHKNRFVSGKIR